MIMHVFGLPQEPVGILYDVTASVSDMSAKGQDLEEDPDFVPQKKG